MKFSRILQVTLGLACVAPAFGQFQNTGATTNATDPNWSVSGPAYGDSVSNPGSGPAYIITPYSTYLQPPAGVQWIDPVVPGADGMPQTVATGIYTYTTTFTDPGFLALQYASDNEVTAIQLKNSLGQTWNAPGDESLYPDNGSTLAFSNWQTPPIDFGTLANATYTLTFAVNNDAGYQGEYPYNPTALIVQGLSSSQVPQGTPLIQAVPEPFTLALGVSGLGLAFRRIRSAATSPIMPVLLSR